VLSALVLPLESGAAVTAAGAEAVEETDGTNIPVNEGWKAAAEGTLVSGGANTSSERSMLTVP
jgi:hypothetical protein